MPFFLGVYALLVLILFKPFHGHVRISISLTRDKPTSLILILEGTSDRRTVI